MAAEGGFLSGGAALGLGALASGVGSLVGGFGGRDMPSGWDLYQQAKHNYIGRASGIRKGAKKYKLHPALLAGAAGTSPVIGQPSNKGAAIAAAGDAISNFGIMKEQLKQQKIQTEMMSLQLKDMKNPNKGKPLGDYENSVVAQATQASNSQKDIASPIYVHGRELERDKQTTGAELWSERYGELGELVASPIAAGADIRKWVLKNKGWVSRYLVMSEHEINRRVNNAKSTKQLDNLIKSIWKGLQRSKEFFGKHYNAARRAQ
jgi:hypothetical protein